jgi:hypothetical protein
MASETYRGVVRGGTVVLEDATALTDGTEVLVTPLVGESGSSGRVLAALVAAPHVPNEWVDELEQLIAEGQRPPSREALFIS